MACTLLPVALVLPVRFEVKSQLRNFVGGPVTTAVISLVVGTVALAVAAQVVQRSLPEPRPDASRGGN